MFNSKIASINPTAPINDKSLDKAIDDLNEPLSLKDGISILIPTGAQVDLAEKRFVAFKKIRATALKELKEETNSAQ